MQVIGTIVVVALSQWYLIFPALVMVILILLTRAAYIKTARDLKRFEGIYRSPLYNSMTVALNGLATIRAFEAQPLFIRQFYRFQNGNIWAKKRKSNCNKVRYYYYYCYC